MYLIPNSRNTSAIKSEPYCALLLRPIPAAQTSGVPLVCSAIFSSVAFVMVKLVRVYREEC